MHSGVSRLRAGIGVFALSGVIALGACTPEEPVRAPRHRIAKVNSFTEATPVYRVISAPPYAFAATASGLDQWDLRSGRRIRRDTGNQLFTARIADLAYDASRATLWLVGTDGIARYDLASDTVTKLDPPATGVGPSALATAVLTPATDGGLYLGVANSLYYADAAGAWTEAALDAPVSALHVDEDGGVVYVGTAAGLFTMRGSSAKEVDCDMAAVNLLLPAPGGGVLAIGVAEAGAARVALAYGDVCNSYRPSPAVPWLDAASDGERVIVLTSSRVYELALANPTERARALSREGMTLIATRPAASVDAPPLEIRALGASVPPGAQTVAFTSGELLVGTHSLGTARLSMERRGERSTDSRWLRRQELANRAAMLTIDCTSRDECRLANGSGELWRFDGERFTQRGPTQTVLGMLETRMGAVSVTREAGSPVVKLISAPATGELAEPVVLATLRVPVGYQLRRLRRGPGQGVLLGWAPESVRAHGSAQTPNLDAATEAPLSLVHLAMLTGDGDRTLGVGGSPLLDIVACGGQIYVSSVDGVANVSAATPVFVSEKRAAVLDCDREQLVAATETSISRMTGSEWTELVPLSQPVRDFAVAGDGRVYLADHAGLGIWDGSRVRRYDVRRGLLENDLREIALDRFGRIWIRGASSVGLFRL